MQGKRSRTTIIKFFEQKAKESGFSKLSLTVVQDNDVALKLYQKWDLKLLEKLIENRIIYIK